MNKDVSYLSTGGEDNFLPKLISAINSAKKNDMTVALKAAGQVLFCAFKAKCKT